MEIINKKVSELIPYVNNTRTHSDEQVQQIASSIKEFGFTNPVLIDEKNGVIAGHGRIMGAKLLQLDEIPTITLKGLSEAQVKAYIIADNKLALNAGWDKELLKVEIEALQEMDFNIDLLGFDMDELEDLDVSFDDNPILDEGKADEVPELAENPCIKLGDLIELGHNYQHRLLCGDSTSESDVSKLMDGKKADMVFTDPPYGYKYESNFQSTHKQLRNDDIFLDFIPVLKNHLHTNTSIFLCTSFQVVSEWISYSKKYFEYKNLIVWKKNNWSMGDLKGSFAGQHENIIFLKQGDIKLVGSRDTDIWEFNRVPPELHPTMKPVELIEYAINKMPCSKILDVFGGSGSTLIASENTNKDCFINEIDEKYAQVIVQRYVDYTSNPMIKINGVEYDWEVYKDENIK